MSGLLSLIARVMIAAIFLGSGVEKAMNAKKTIETMAGVGIPYPNLLYFGALAFLFVGGVLVVLGLFTRLGALLLMVFGDGDVLLPPGVEGSVSADRLHEERRNLRRAADAVR